MVSTLLWISFPSQMVIEKVEEFGIKVVPKKFVQSIFYLLNFFNDFSPFDTLINYCAQLWLSSALLS